MDTNARRRPSAIPCFIAIRRSSFLGVLALSLLFCFAAQAHPFQERQLFNPRAPQATGIQANDDPQPPAGPARGGGVFGIPGVSVVPGSRVMDWSGPFDGDSLRDFKACVIALNNADRARAAESIGLVRKAALIVNTAVAKVREEKSEPKSVERTLIGYQKQLGAIESELSGVLKGKYPQRLLMMNSPGGYVYTLKGMLPYLTKDMDIYGGQMIASAGGVAFVAAKGKRIMPESGGQLGIHSVQSGVEGSARDVEFALRQMKDMNRFLEQKYVQGSKGKITRSQFRQWIQEASTSPEGMKWLTGRQSMQTGICDGLSRDPSRLIDSYRPTEIKVLVGDVSSFLESHGMADLMTQPLVPQHPHRGPGHDLHRPEAPAATATR